MSASQDPSFAKAIESTGSAAIRVQQHPAATPPIWLQAAVTGLILILGAIEGWFKRTDFSTDAISYLDISRAIPLHDWKMIFNPLWSSGYPLLLALARPFFAATPAGEWLSIHIVNFIIFIAAWFSYLYMVRSLPVFANSQPDSERNSEFGSGSLNQSTFLFLAAASIFLAIQLCIDSVSRVGPDLLVSTFFFLATALVIRILAAPSNSRAVLLGPVLGFILGLGYWTKGIFLALALTLLAVTAVALLAKKRSFAPVLFNGAIFAVLVAPYAAALSWSYGHFTLGESGPLNYAFHVNLLPRWTNWQGGPAGYGTPIHPTHQLLKNPDIFEFAEPYHNTYPPFGNISYWYQGYRHFWSLKYQVVGIGRDLQALVQALDPQPIFYAVLLAAALIFFTQKDRRNEWLRTVLHRWPFYVPALVGVLLYVQVHLEDRYLGSFLTILCLSPFAAFAALPVRKMQTAVLAILIVGSLIDYLYVDRDVLAHIRTHTTYAQNPQWKLGLALAKAGLQPGDAIAVVGGPNASCTWAYIDHLRIVAELGGEPYDQHHPVPPSEESAVQKFWHSSAADKQKVLSVFRQTSAVAVIASAKPADTATPEGWQHLDGSDTWLYRLR